MTVDDFIKMAKDQPTMEVSRMASVHGPTLKALLASGKPILISELIAHPDQHQELQKFRYSHILGAGLNENSIERWQSAHVGCPMPLDMKAFLTRVNGIHLWGDLVSARAYFGILPLAEWKDVRETDWGAMFKPPPLGHLVISYHDNGDYYLVLDTLTPKYLWYDLQDFDHPRQFGSTVAELLDFWWQETSWLDPRKTDSVAT